MADKVEIAVIADTFCALLIVALFYGLLAIIPIANWLHKRGKPRD